MNAVPTWKAHCALLGGLDLEDEVPSSQAVALLDAHLPVNAQRSTSKHIEQLCEGSRTCTHPERSAHRAAQAGNGKRMYPALLTHLMVPGMGAATTVSIFMALKMARGWPLVTLAPSAT